MTTTSNTQHRTTTPVATAAGRTARPRTARAARRLTGLAVGTLAAVLLTAGASQGATSAPPSPAPSSGSWPSAPTCAELQKARSVTSSSCEWYRSRAIAQARVRACTSSTAPSADVPRFRFLTPAPY